MNPISAINKKVDELKFSYYGIMGASLMIGSCSASIALMVILMNDAPMWQLALICTTAMGSNAASIAHSPIRWVAWAFIINMIASILLFVANVI